MLTSLLLIIGTVQIYVILEEFVIKINNYLLITE